MPSTLDLNPIYELPVSDRYDVVHSILESIAVDTRKLPISDELKAELDRRLEADEANPEAGVPWEQVEAAALARIRR